ncbi:tyrosine-type recombinase/integrase [Shinella sp. HZN7]|uniref:tyrosine-type recombinase/integrase n=1 Tax=Shinella sp. (strain HZN7) TaxID=879274 RepID=UPI000A07AC7D|nr:tyrosine-type recombinase/integrase [Shinella sp. HZN7]
MADGILLPALSAGNAQTIAQSNHHILPAGRTFAEAAQSYVHHGGEGRYLKRVVAYFGDRTLATIFPFDIRQMALSLYPDHSGATRNRQAIAPARAVMIHAYERGWCGLLRLRRFKEEAPRRKKPASQAWLHAFARQCHHDGLDNLACLVLFMATTGARVSEAINLRWSEVDFAQRTALLLKTKTERNSPRTLTDEMINRLSQLQPGKKAEERVFRYACRQSVNTRIRAVCQRAGISYKSSHACGRHSFATNALDLGLDIKTVMHAGRWRSSAVFLGVYVHPRKNAGRIVADRLSQYAYDTEI